MLLLRQQGSCNEHNGWVDEGLFERRAEGSSGRIRVAAHRYVKQLT
ncbi:hypothetical protein [Pseudonocardia nigra]|nr:hypothetical protein [Pseudonocardia nigra]